MSDENTARTHEGEALLKEHLIKVEAQAKLFLSALKGFRRDLTLSIQASPSFFEPVFPEPVAMLAVPPLQNGMSFSDLQKMLSLAEDAIDGKIGISNPPAGPNQDEREKLSKEIDITHQNLLDVSDTAYRLYESIQTAGFEFDVFNTKNIEVGYEEANILFNRDAQNLAMGTARALSERAIRLDIDLVENKRRLESGERQK